MGQVIRRSAPVDDILSDARRTLERAVARGGEWKTVAESHLAALLGLASSVDRLLEEAQLFAVPMNAALASESVAAEALVARITDACWNLMGRPVNDPTFELVFSGAISDAVTDLPDRMELLEDLLRSHGHLGIAAEQAEGFAQELARSASLLRSKVDVARPVPVRVALATKMRAEIAREVQLALVSLARTWRANGKTEAEIDEIIPDRSV